METAKFSWIKRRLRAASLMPRCAVSEVPPSPLGGRALLAWVRFVAGLHAHLWWRFVQGFLAQRQIRDTVPRVRQVID